MAEPVRESLGADERKRCATAHRAPAKTGRLASFLAGLPSDPNAPLWWIWVNASCRSVPWSRSLVPGRRQAQFGLNRGATVAELSLSG